MKSKKIIKFSVLEDVLRTLRFHGTIFFRSDLAAPWGMSLASVKTPRFHIMLSGNCYVGIDKNNTVNMKAHDILMLPNGHAHWIADQTGRKMIPSQRAGEACELGQPLFQQGEITHKLMCGLISFDHDMPHPILDSFPKSIHFPKIKDSKSIWTTVTAIDEQMNLTQGRSDLIVDRLTEALFIQLLNHKINDANSVSGFFLALNDRRVNHVLTLIHQDLSHNWTLSSLSDKAGMSRATLIRHFRNYAGITPMAYVTNWRVIKSYNLVKYTTEPLEKVAQHVGFSSAKILNKIFLRYYKLTPKKLRVNQFK